MSDHTIVEVCQESKTVIRVQTSMLGAALQHAVLRMRWVQESQRSTYKLINNESNTANKGIYVRNVFFASNRRVIVNNELQCTCQHSL
jgi:hypothetical protein